MSRNSAGTYTLPTSGNPVVSGTTISSTAENAFRADVATELSNSLDRQGRGSMLAPLQLVDGSSSAPGLSFGGEVTSGRYRAGSGDVREVVQGIQVAQYKADGTANFTAPVVGGSTGLGFTMANPGSATAFKDKVTPKNVAKAWATIKTDGAGGATLLDGFNISSISNGNPYVTINFAQAFANNNYAVVGSTSDGRIIGTYGGAGSGKLAGSAHVAAYTGVSSLSNPLTTALEFSVVFYGQQ